MWAISHGVHCVTMVFTSPSAFCVCFFFVCCGLDIERLLELIMLRLVKLDMISCAGAHSMMIYNRLFRMEICLRL